MTLLSKFGRALPDSEPVSSTAVGKKGSEGKLLPAAAVLSAGPAHHQKPAVCKEPNYPHIHKVTLKCISVSSHHETHCTVCIFEIVFK